MTTIPGGTRVAVLRESGGAMLVETVRVGRLAADEVVVRVAGVGICHTDIAARDQIIPVPLPIVLGHEAAGIVVSTGPEVADIAVGDHVVLTFASCGACPACNDAVPAYCDSFVPRNFAGRRLDGSTAYSDSAGPVGSHFFGQSSFAELAVASRRNVVKVASALPLEMLGPLGCGVQTGAGVVLKSLDCRPGSVLVIFGAGAVGLSAVLAAAARGCGQVIVVEPVAARRELALEIGATAAFDPAAITDVTAAVRNLAPRGADYSLDLTGIPSVIETALAVLAKRGVCALVGAPQHAGQTVALRFGMLVQQGIRIIGVMEGDCDPVSFIPELLAMQAEGRFPFEKLITLYPFADIERAIADQAAGRCVKAVLVTRDTDASLQPSLAT